MDYAVAQPAAELYRIGRASDPFFFSRISDDDAVQARAGNRFDVPGGGVMYFASQPEGSYAETLARFRPSARARDAVGDEPGFMICGGVPADWRQQRVLVSATVPGAVPFLDVEAPETHEYLTTVLAARLTELGVSVLDVATVRGPDRLITRAIASWAYGAQHEDGTARFAGLRYMSRLGDHECWAVFDGTVLEEVSRRPIELSDRALQAVADLFALRMF